MKISGTYQLAKWEEKELGSPNDGKKATRVSAEFSFSGDIVGTADVEYLMFYTLFDPSDAHKAVAHYVGLFKITGKLKGASGSFAFADRGSYESGAARSVIEIIPGSGTDELSRLSGSGTYMADPTGSSWEMDITV